MNPAPDLTGVRFTRLTVLRLECRRGRHQLLRCRCDCGSEHIVQRSNLQSGNTLSCGCLNRQRITKHGQSRTATYRSWSTMRDRCTNPNNPEHHNYAGRGITCAPEWRDFRAFLRDMGPRPAGLTLHRINNELGYSKDNCCWADTETQVRNRRRDGLKWREDYNPIAYPRERLAA